MQDASHSDNESVAVGRGIFGDLNCNSINRGIIHRLPFAKLNLEPVSANVTFKGPVQL